MKYANTLEEVYINSRELSVMNTIDDTLTKMEGVINYKNLPLTIPKRILAKYAMTKGSYIVYQYKGETYISDAKPSGEPNLYGEPSKVSVKHHEETLELTLDVDAVLIRNDSYCRGIYDLVTEYAILSAQSKISMWRMLIELRSNNILRAKDENSYQSAMDFLDAQRAGDLAVIMSEDLGGLDGMESYNTPTVAGQATQLIELAQYIKSDYWGEFGVNVNNNMKSQYVNESEISKTTGMPLINNMLECAKDGWARANALFDLDVVPYLSEEWDDEQEQEEENDEQDSIEDGGEHQETETESVEAVEEENEATTEETDEPEDTDETEELEAGEVIESAKLLSEEDEYGKTETSEVTGADTGETDTVENEQDDDLEPEEEDDEESKPDVKA